MSTTTSSLGTAPLEQRPVPASAGIGLRFPHHRHVAEQQPAIPWFEVHAENYLAGGAPLRALLALREHHELSLHAVGLSLGSDARPDETHLNAIADLVRRTEPALVSDHLSWSLCDGLYLADLLPVPYTDEALAVLARNIDIVQTALGRTILIENPSSYLTFAASWIDEAEFLAELARRTGCGILLDVNNLFVSAHNIGLKADAYLKALPAAAVREIHLAGHAQRELNGRPVLIDHHGDHVAPEVWDLYARTLARLGPVPTLIEWDTDLPQFAVLEKEAALAETMLRAVVHMKGREARHAHAA